ncbi:MAG: host nuclease inhibitor protein [Proteobacteria bacterium]|nr:host nuclease inhibitor protein [Pseudomonadota bacterium]
MKAWCWASGVIEFGRVTPVGAILIAKGPAKPLREFISVRARHAYDGETLLVPSVPEAKQQWRGVLALRKWCDWCGKGAPEGVEFT